MKPRYKETNSQRPTIATANFVSTCSIGTLCVDFFFLSFVSAPLPLPAPPPNITAIMSTVTRKTQTGRHAHTVHDLRCALCRNNIVVVHPADNATACNSIICDAYCTRIERCANRGSCRTTCFIANVIDIFSHVFKSNIANRCSFLIAYKSLPLPRLLLKLRSHVCKLNIVNVLE